MIVLNDGGALPSLESVYAALKDKHVATLVSGTFGDPQGAIEALNIDSLVVTLSNVSFDKTVLTLSGTAVLFGMNDRPVTVRAMGDSKRQVIIAFELPDGWNFATSFSSLPRSYRPVVDMPGMMVMGPSVLGDLGFSAASLHAQNCITEGRPAGLNFRGTLKTNAAADWLAIPLGLSSTPTLAGQIVLHPSAAPDINLIFGQTPATFSIGGAFNVDDAYLVIRTRLTEEGKPITAIDLCATVAIGTTDPVKAQVASPLLPGSQLLTLDAVLAPGVLSLGRGIDALAEFAGVPKTDLPLPTGVLHDLSLVEILVALDWSVPQVRHIQFAIGTAQPWTIVDGLDIRDLRMGWKVHFPFDKDLRGTSASLIGTLHVGSQNPILFDVAAYSRRGFMISGTMQSGSVVSLSDLVAKSLGTDPSHLPKLTVTMLEIDASSDGTFAMQAELTTWGLALPGISLSLDKLTGSFKRTTAGTSGSIAGLFALGSVQLWILAAVPTPGAAFQFLGETYGDSQQIPLGDMADGLTKTFNVRLPDALTAWLDHIVLTKVNVSFDDQAGDFRFSCLGTVMIADTTAIIDLEIAANRDKAKVDNPYGCTVTGLVTIGTRSFVLLLDATTTALAAHYANARGDAIDVKALVSEAAASLGALVPNGIAIGVKDVVLVLTKGAKGTDISLGFALDASLDLADLPLVGGALSVGATLAIDKIHLTYSSAGLDAAAVASLSASLAKAGVTLPSRGLAIGVDLTAELSIDGTAQALSLTVPGGATTAGASGNTQNAGDGAGNAPQSTGATFYDIQKQLGPIDFKRIGAQYADNILMFMLDASIAIGPLTLSMDGLGVGSSVKAFSPVFSLAGLGIDYQQPSISITGGLLHVPGSQLSADTKFEYAGTLVIEAGAYGLAAVGSYAQLTSGDPSMFVFAEAEVPLGGPPAFFITGLMGGFGYNRSLRIPGQDEVLDFPLLRLAGKGSHDPMAVLDLLEGRAPSAGSKCWIQPAPGNNWMAVGLTFSSFEIVQSKALLILDIGSDFQAALVGLSTMRLPQPDDNAESYVYAELELEAVLKPKEGFLGITAILSRNSYVLTPDCHLTGGFAFSVWYGPSEQAGQFVLTLGGYHPAFVVPSYFPQVPRLGFNWAVSGNVTIKGDAYFALTASVAMGGGSLQILFHDGDLNAWFTAQADFLVSWQPFFFTADIDVDIGVSYRLNLLFCHKTISVSVGASVHMYGPPTGGTVHVHLWVVSFSVDFGADEKDGSNDALTWKEFQRLLPAAQDIVRITAKAGLTRTMNAAVVDGAKVWVVRAGAFQFSTRSAIPASVLRYRSSPGVSAPGKQSIRPMNIAGNLDSVHELTLSREVVSSTGQPRKWVADDAIGWTMTPRTGAVPESLWGSPVSPFSQTPGVPTANVLSGELIGFDVVVPTARLGTSRGSVAMKLLAEELLTPSGVAPFYRNVEASNSHLPVVAATSIADVRCIAGDEAAAGRMNIFSILSKATSEGLPISAGTNGDVTLLATQAGHLFSDAPMEVA